MTSGLARMPVKESVRLRRKNLERDRKNITAGRTRKLRGRMGGKSSVDASQKRKRKNRKQGRPKCANSAGIVREGLQQASSQLVADE